MYNVYPFFLLALLFNTVLLFSMEEEQKLPSFDEWYTACKKLPLCDHRIPQGRKKTPLNNDHQKQQNFQFFEVMTKYINLKAKQLQAGPWIGEKKDTIFEKNSQACLQFEASSNVNYIIDLPTFDPYVQKNIIESEKSIIITFGDLHGDVESLNEALKYLVQHNMLDKNNKFKTKNNTYLYFLGDYIDRGWYGCEVLYTLLRLAIENPDNVFLIRGNHEDIRIYADYGFVREISGKFPTHFAAYLTAINKIFELMPAACYLGGKNKDGLIQYLQCCHGGIECGYNPLTRGLLDSPHALTYQLLDTVDQKGFFENLKKENQKLYNSCVTSENALYDTITNKRLATHKTAIPTEALYTGKPTSPTMEIKTECSFLAYHLGYMWTDFCTDPNEHSKYSFSRGIEFNKELTEYVLKSFSSKKSEVVAIIRAHQHGTNDAYPMMRRILNIDQLSNSDDKGVGELWKPRQNGTGIAKNSVFTLCVTPNGTYGSAYPKLRELGYAITKLNHNAELGEWHLSVIRLKDKENYENTSF
jgi:hypothetical protein